MGTYTELVVAIELKKDPPAQVVDVLRFLTSADAPWHFTGDLPDHPFFKCQRWTATLRGDSYYFAGQTHSEFVYDDIPARWVLTVRSNLKSYDDEVAKFVDWIEPYSEPQNVKNDGTYFVGYTRCEENDDPTLVYLRVTRAEAGSQELK